MLNLAYRSSNKKYEWVLIDTSHEFAFKVRHHFTKKKQWRMNTKVEKWSFVFRTWYSVLYSSSSSLLSTSGAGTYILVTLNPPHSSNWVRLPSSPIDRVIFISGISPEVIKKVSLDNFIIVWFFKDIDTNPTPCYLIWINNYPGDHIYSCQNYQIHFSSPSCFIPYNCHFLQFAKWWSKIVVQNSFFLCFVICRISLIDQVAKPLTRSVKKQAFLKILMYLIFSCQYFVSKWLLVKSINIIFQGICFRKCALKW